MRHFKHYAPEMIAKHISRLFNGTIYIDGIGEFNFKNSQLIIPTQAAREHYQIVKEINLEVNRLKVCY